MTRTLGRSGIEVSAIGMGCWAHARRKFEPLIEAGPHPRATWILTEIQKLYDIEDRAKEMTDEARHGKKGLAVFR